MTGSKYGKEYTVPKEFPSVLKSFTREVLRSQPGDIYEFGAQYFTELLAQEEAAAAAENAGPRRLSPDELQDLLANMFQEADEDGSGALSPAEFKTVLAMADIGLTDREIKRVMAEADFNDDGEISYEEFVPLAVDLVQSLYTKMEMEAEKEANEAAAREEAQNYLLHGMTKEEVEGVMSEIFHKSDDDGSGTLSLKEFQKCCKDADIGLTRKEVNILMHQCDVDGDGCISYEEFVPLCFEMLTEILKDELLREKRNPSELEVFLIELFGEADFEQKGTLNPLMLKEALKGADFGLTRLQIHSILAQGEYDEDGECNYKKFAPIAAENIYKILDPETQRERRQAIDDNTGQGQNFNIIHDLGAEDMAAYLEQEFAAADAGNTGLLSLAAVQATLAGCKLGLSAMEVNGIISAAEVDASGMVIWNSLAAYAFYILQYLAQSAAAF